MFQESRPIIKAKRHIRVFVRVRPVVNDDFKAYDGTQESF
jgi:hypothetical protein